MNIIQEIFIVMESSFCYLFYEQLWTISDKRHFSRCLVTAIAVLTHAYSITPEGPQDSTKATATRTFENIKKAIIGLLSKKYLLHVLQLHLYHTRLVHFLAVTARLRSKNA